MYLLDTDTIIYILKGNPVVERNLRKHYYDPIKASVVTLMELYYGAYKSQKVASNLAKLKLLETSLEILPLGPEVVDVFGLQKAALEKKGSRLDDFDLILACSALSHNLILVTNNIRHFRKIEGLRMVNWTQDSE